jgi:hypothetical protein
MSKDPAKLEKALAKQARRDARKEAIQAARPQIITSFAAPVSIAGAEQWPFRECLITSEWRDTKQITQLLIVRENTRGQVVVGVLLVDLACLGLKNGFARGFASYRSFELELLNDLRERQEVTPCSLDLAAKIAQVATDYARGLGFEPHRDTKTALRLLAGAQPDLILETIPTGGPNGKPFYINGPADDSQKILRTLERTVGVGHFEMLVGVPGAFGFDDDFDVLGR